MARETVVQSQVESYQRLKKMVLDASLLNTRQYKVGIKGKVEQSREIGCALPYTSRSSYQKGSLRVILDWSPTLLSCYIKNWDDLKKKSVISAPKTCSSPPPRFLVSVINCYHINGLGLFWDSFEWFCVQIISDTKYISLSCPRNCNWRLIVVKIYYFQIWNKKAGSGCIDTAIWMHYMDAN